MTAGAERFAASVVTVLLVAAACTSATTPAPTSPPPATASPDPMTTPAITVLPATPSEGATSPSPPPRTGDPLLDTVVVTVADRVRVRSEPRVSDDSEKYEPVLALGTSLYVFGGPVAASGYDWYEIAPVSLGPFAPGISSGWVAAASRDGEPWIAAGSPECPPVPTDVTALVRLPLGARLACFSGQPVTVVPIAEVHDGSLTSRNTGGSARPDARLGT